MIQMSGENGLPSLRCARAHEVAGQIAERNAVPRGVAVEIARAVIDIIGADTRRTGHRCVDCDSRIEWSDDGRSPKCPKCGPLGYYAPLALDITFPPPPSPPVSSVLPVGQVNP